MAINWFIRRETTVSWRLSSPGYSEEILPPAAAEALSPQRMRRSTSPGLRLASATAGGAEFHILNTWHLGLSHFHYVVQPKARNAPASIVPPETSATLQGTIRPRL